MSQPQQPERNITADQGFARMMEVLSKWVPTRLAHTQQARRGLRALRGRR